MNLEKAQAEFKKRGCILLATQFVNKLTKMDYTCKCGAPCLKTYAAFISNPYCRKCNTLANKSTTIVPTSNVIMGKQFTYQEVADYFDQYDCVLLSTIFINKKLPLEFLCFCGMTAEKSLENFQTAPHCLECKVNKCYEKAVEYYLKKGCELLSDKLSLLKPMAYKCFCGRIETFKNYPQFYRRPFCGNCEIYKYLDLIETFFASTGCVLITPDLVINSTRNFQDLTPLGFVCKCGNDCSKSLLKFQKSPQCKKCDSSKYLLIINEYYKKHNCILISENLVITSSKYFQDPTPLQYYCSCGRPDLKSLSDFIRAPYCDTCSYDINFQDIIVEDFINGNVSEDINIENFTDAPQAIVLGEKRRPKIILSFEQTVTEFSKYGYTLLETIETYISSYYSKCLCPKNHDTKAKLYLLKMGAMCCKECVKEKKEYNLLGVFIKKTFKDMCVNRYGITSILDLQYIDDIPHSSKEFKALLLLYNTINPEYSETKEKEISTFFAGLQDIDINVNEFIDMIRNSYFKKYNNLANLPGFAEKSIKTCIDTINKMGQLNIEIPKLKSSVWKDYTLPSGKITRCQGYEIFCFDDLLYSEGYNEVDILNERNDMPKILYMLDEKEHRYFPDFFIPKENRIIEVKSSYTYEFDLLKNTAKGHATKKLGYNYEIRIYGPSSEILKTIVF